MASYLDLIQHIGEVDVYGELGLLKGKPVKIVLKENAKPYSVAAPRRIPIPLLPRVEEELRRMEQNGIIEQVTEPTEVSPMVPVLANGASPQANWKSKDLRRTYQAK